MDSLDRFFAEHNFAETTRETYQHTLRQFLREIEPATLTAQSLRAWLNSHRWGSSMQWGALCAVRRYLRWRFGADHPALALRIRRHESPPQRFLSLAQVQTMAGTFDTSSPKGRRDLAMFGVLLNCALRASELCRLSLRYLDLGSQSLRVIVKGGHWSKRVFDAYTAVWLHTWLADREQIAVSGVDAVFVGIGGLTPGRPLTRGGLRCVVREWGKAAGVGKLSPHDFRRSMGSIATQLGAPEDVAMKGGGWKNHAVFRRYTVGVTADDLRPYSPTTAAMERGSNADR